MKRNILRTFSSGSLGLLFGAGFSPTEGATTTLNGFDVSNAAVPVQEIRSGGPPRDGIPAIDNPKYLTTAEATFMREDDLVISLQRGNGSRAYPLRIMLWHEIVNDKIGDEALVVTYCPLCGTAMVFDGMVNGRRLTFGVSGLLYNSDVLMYDRQTESLWSQLALKSLAGPQVGQTIKWLPSQVLTWAAWKKKNPNGEVLSTETGFRRDYSYNPYSGYEQSSLVWFGVPVNRTDFSNKEWMLGVLRNGAAKAYVLSTLPGGRPIHDLVGGSEIQVVYNPQTRQAVVTDPKTGEELPAVLSYWFAWQAFYPGTEIWQPIQLALDSKLRLTVSGEKTKRYGIERSEDFKTWTGLTTVTTTTEGRAELEVGNSAARARFFRVRMVQ